MDPPTVQEEQTTNQLVAHNQQRCAIRLNVFDRQLISSYSIDALVDKLNQVVTRVNTMFDKGYHTFPFFIRVHIPFI